MGPEFKTKKKKIASIMISARKFVIFWHQSEARTAATVWNWSGKTLSPGALLAVLYFSSLHIYFSARLDFSSSPLLACSRLRDSGEKSFSKKKCEKLAGAVPPPFPSRVRLIFALLVLIRPHYTI